MFLKYDSARNHCFTQQSNFDRGRLSCLSKNSPSSGGSLQIFMQSAFVPLRGILTPYSQNFRKPAMRLAIEERA